MIFFFFKYLMAKFFLAWNIPASVVLVEMPLASLSSYCNMLVCLFCLLGFFLIFLNGSQLLFSLS